MVAGNLPWLFPFSCRQHTFRSFFLPFLSFSNFSTNVKTLLFTPVIPFNVCHSTLLSPFMPPPKCRSPYLALNLTIPVLSMKLLSFTELYNSTNNKKERHLLLFSVPSYFKDYISRTSGTVITSSTALSLSFIFFLVQLLCQGDLQYALLRLGFIVSPIDIQQSCLHHEVMLQFASLGFHTSQQKSNQQHTVLNKQMANNCKHIYYH